MAHEYKIIVNGTENEVQSDQVTFNEVTKIAFPNIPPDPASNAFSVSFEHAESKPHKGSLAHGGSVTVKKHGTTFDVIHTNRA